MAMRVRVEDFTQQVSARVSGARHRALAIGGEFILENANRTVPIEEGTLMRSGKVTVGDDEAAVSYDTPYAVRQHEDTRLRHDPGRRAKWLERTLAEQQQQTMNLMAQEIRKGLVG